MTKFKVVCIDDKNKPSIVPQSSWIEKGETYTVVAVANMFKQGMTLGFKLAEVSLPEGSPFEYYQAKRFRPYSDVDMLAETEVSELLKDQDLVLL